MKILFLSLSLLPQGREAFLYSQLVSEMVVSWGNFRDVFPGYLERFA